MLQVNRELQQVYPEYAKEHWTGCAGKESEFKFRLYRHLGIILTDRFSPDVPPHTFHNPGMHFLSIVLPIMWFTVMFIQINFIYSFYRGRWIILRRLLNLVLIEVHDHHSLCPINGFIPHWTN